VIKTAVFNREGTCLGHVDDLSIEKVSGRVIYAIISFGVSSASARSFTRCPGRCSTIMSNGFTVLLDEAVLRA
jgi:hypothetical protein